MMELKEGWANRRYTYLCQTVKNGNRFPNYKDGILFPPDSADPADYLECACLLQATAWLLGVKGFPYSANFYIGLLELLPQELPCET